MRKNHEVTDYTVNRLCKLHNQLCNFILSYNQLWCNHNWLCYKPHIKYIQFECLSEIITNYVNMIINYVVIHKDHEVLRDNFGRTRLFFLKIHSLSSHFGKKILHHETHNFFKTYRPSSPITLTHLTTFISKLSQFKFTL